MAKVGKCGESQYLTLLKENKLKLPETRGAKRKYPWDELKKEGDFFIWDKPEDIRRIHATAVNHNIKIACRTIDNKLHVFRVG